MITYLKINHAILTTNCILRKTVHTKTHCFEDNDNKSMIECVQKCETV